MPGLLVVGTDTGVGKTVVTAAIARCLHQRGQAVAVCKPIATGAEDGVADDTRRLADAIGDGDYPRVTPWTFPLAAAPPVAAREAGVVLVLNEIANYVERMARTDALLLVEGVGGLLCPLTKRETVADLARMLGFRLVIVARRSLGTLNHTLLTLEVAHYRGLGVAGVVVNETSPVQSHAEQTNVAELAKRIAVPLLAVVEYRSNPYEGEIESLAAVDWRGLAN